MAYVTDIRTGGASVVHNIATLRSNLQARYAQYATYRNTLRELRALSSRELDDLGLNRYALQVVAHEAAYGRK